MAFYGLRLKYALEGSSNYIAWKDRMEVVLEDNGLKEFIDQEIPKPASTNAQELAEWKKCVAKADGSSLREFETILSRVSMGRILHFQCGRH